MYTLARIYFAEGIKEQKVKVSKFRADLQRHKDDAQEALECYRTLVMKAQAGYTEITALLKKDRTNAEEEQLQTLQENYSAFASADYMMSKNLPFWGESPQPAKTYYQMKLVCDVLGIVEHSKKPNNYTYFCDELAAGPKNTDHTISFLQHFIDSHIDSWVQNITFCLDNARICKCKYLLAWADQLVEKGRFKKVSFMYLVVGHTKFEPDRLFSSIAKTFYARDVFCIEMLQDIATLYSNSCIFTSKQIMHWRSALEEKYTALSGITDLHEFVIRKVSSGTELKTRETCYNGSYQITTIRKPNFDDSRDCRPLSYEHDAPQLTSQKLHQLTEQYNRYIKSDLVGYRRPSFLCQSEGETGLVAASAPDCVSKAKRSCPLCDGTGHIHAGKKRHYVERFCPIAAKRRK